MRQISAMIEEEVYEKGKKSGMKWGALVEFGLEIGELRADNRVLKATIEQLQRARDRLQSALLERGD